MDTNSKNFQYSETRLEESNRRIRNGNYPILEDELAKENSVKSVMNSVISGAAGGIAGAGGVMLITSFKEPEVQNVDPDTKPQSIHEPTHFNGSEVPIAHNVNDNMSFSKAFAEARHEVGPGGVFQWRGGVYGTYYVNEWQAFSPEYKQAFSNYHYAIESHNESYLHSGSNHLTNVYPKTGDTDEIMFAPENEETVSVLNTGHIEIDGQEVSVVSAVVDGQDAVFFDMDLDDNYDIVVVNDTGNPANPSIYLLDDGIGIEQIEELNDTTIVDDPLNHGYDFDNDLSDFNNDADISDFVI